MFWLPLNVDFSYLNLFQSLKPGFPSLPSLQVIFQVLQAAQKDQLEDGDLTQHQPNTHPTPDPNHFGF